MNQKSRLLAFFQSHNNQVTLLQLIDARFIKYTQRISELREDLRARGGDIVCEQDRERPTQNIYRLVLPPANLADVEFKEEGGQLTIAIKERAA